MKKPAGQSGLFLRFLRFDNDWREVGRTVEALDHGAPEGEEERNRGGGCVALWDWCSRRQAPGADAIGNRGSRAFALRIPAGMHMDRTIGGE
jgi:hypothetical protein